MKSVVDARNICKHFAGVRALDGVSLNIMPGEIKCLAGENGSGKSTLIKIITGVYSFDGGEIELNGIPYKKLSPSDATKNGIQVIHQDLSIFPSLTVMENIAINRYIAENAVTINWKKSRQIAQNMLARIKHNIDLDVNVGELSIADKQLTAICRALVNKAKLIIMDEPTTALTKKEVRTLFDIIRELQSDGISVLFVSHKHDEVFEISETYSILRNGKNVASGLTAELNHDKFAYHMTGRHIENTKTTVEPKENSPFFKVEGLSCKGMFKNVSFDLSKGEILGITGLLGSGRTELALCLFGLITPTSGKIILDGKEIKIRNTFDAQKYKIGYLPEDRLTEGLFLQQSIGRNIIVSKLSKLCNRLGLLDKAKSAFEIDKWVMELNIVTPDTNALASSLSGGNQQRIVLAKWLATDLDVLILNGPTVGVDIGSKHEIHLILRRLAENGMIIIIISDDIPEIVANCNKVITMKRGAVVSELVSDEISETILTSLMR